MAAEKKIILSKEVAEKKLRRLALEICERNYREPELVLIGIKDSGMVLAEKICAYLKETFAGNLSVHALSMDKKTPGDVIIEPYVNSSNKVVVLVDDVANSGKTMLYAVKPLLKTYPKKIQTLALVERTHKSFPINIDYSGLSVSTSLNEHIFVEVANGEILGVWMQ